MSDRPDYYKAYLRQKAARENAEAALELRARELFESNESLRAALESLQEQKNHLVQQEKLASIGLLAAGVAHEINNPIGFVKSNLQTLLTYLEAITKPLKSYLEIADELYEQPIGTDIRLKLQSINLLLEKEDIRFIATDSVDSIQEGLAGINRVEDIIRNLKDYSRTESDKRSLLDVNMIINDSLKLIWNQLKYKCEVFKDLGEIPLIYGSPGQLNQIFVNLAMNAVQAMSSRGTLTISSYCDEESIYVNFVDDGPGIPEDVINKLFDPFFTTKEVGSGTGLGLYVSYGLAKKHGGDIQAANNQESGATFTVSLPIDIRQSR